MSPVTGLRCRACGAAHDSSEPLQVCAQCWGPLDVVYDLEAAAGALGRPGAPESMWRYAPLLPVGDPGAAGAGIGGTPLTPCPALGGAVGVPDLWVKDETVNPSGSFKDRLVAVALAVARRRGASVAACASTGNLALSVAALAPRFGMRWVALVPADADPGRRARLAAATGGRAVAVEGSYDAVNRLGGELADDHPDWAWVNVGLRTWYGEGARTLAFEIADQLGAAPDRVVVPMASGATALKVAQGFDELRAVDAVDSVPRLTVVQPAGCAPVADAFAAGGDEVKPVRPRTRVESLAMGDPPDGPDVLAAVRRSGGTVQAVPEHAVDPALALLATAAGIAADPAAGVVVAALEQLRRRAVDPIERVVLLITGAAPPAVAETGVEGLTVIPADAGAFEAVATDAIGR